MSNLVTKFPVCSLFISGIGIVALTIVGYSGQFEFLVME